MDENNIKMREFIYSLLYVSEGNSMNVLDVGCGRGYDLQRISELLDGKSTLYGIDSIEHFIHEAVEKYGNDRLRFLHEDIRQGIPFEDEHFDIVYSNNMLECVSDKQKLLQEVHRVLKPGGQVVFAHFDWDSQLMDGNDKALVRNIVQTFNDWKQDWMDDIDAWMGRRLWRTFQESGLFENGRIETYVLTNTRFCEPNYGHMMIHGFRSLVERGDITAEQFDTFIHDLEELDRKGQYFYSITMYIYVGNKVE